MGSSVGAVCGSHFGSRLTIEEEKCELREQNKVAYDVQEIGGKRSGRTARNVLLIEVFRNPQDFGLGEEKYSTKFMMPHGSPAALVSDSRVDKR